MIDTMTRLGAGGRIVVPAAFRRALGVEVGDPLVLVLEDGEMRVVSVPRAVARAQSRVRRYVPEGARLADELLAERRREAAHE